MSDFDHLARPIRIGPETLKNRIVHAAVLTLLVEAQQPSDDFLRYHENRARGGAAMIVSETVNALRGQSGRPNYLNAHNDDGIPGLSRLAERVRAHDCVLLAQLQDRGRGNYSPVRVDSAYGPSALPDDLSGAVPHPLAIDQILDMIDDFAAAAERLRRAGFNGVEISAGHGHLFHQFLSPHSNRRDDAYGGDLSGRTRILAQVIAAIRETCGKNFIIGLKLPADDGLPGGIDLAEAARITAALVRPETVDYAAFAWGSQADTLYWHVPDGHYERAPYVEAIAALRRHANAVPVMALGRIVDPNEAEAILKRGQADFVGLGRALITDPAWPNKALSGRGHAIRPCVSCNTCWAAIAASSPLVCDNNPALASEVEITGVRRVRQGRRRLAVVGGGPAGLEAAWVAAARGHDVTLFGAGRELGGRARLAAMLPGGEGLAGVFEFQSRAARQHGVRMEIGRSVGVQDVLALAPDVVVLATGADMAWPDVLPPDLKDSGIALDLPSLIETLARRDGAQSGTVVIVDEEQSMTTYNAAMWLAARFARVVMITSRESFARRESLVNRQGILRRLLDRNITMLPFSRPDVNEPELIAGVVGYRHVMTGARAQIDDVAAVTHAAHRVPRLALLEELKAAGHAPRIIGDAFAPRGLLQAMQEGFALAMRL